MTSPNQTELAFEWDGFLLTKVQADGVTTGVVTFAYNNDFQVSAITFNQVGFRKWGQPNN